MIQKSVKIHAAVELGKTSYIEDYCIIGVPVKGDSLNRKTVIGDFAIIRSHTVIYAGNIIGSNFSTGNKANIREFNRIGNDVSIGTMSVVEHHVMIGDGVRIHTQVFIPEYTVIENGAWIGPNVVFTNARYPNRPNTKSKLSGVIVREGAVIGANVTILPGIEVGRGALIGAGSVVTSNVEAETIVVGNPAREIKKV